MTKDLRWQVAFQTSETPSILFQQHFCQLPKEQQCQLDTRSKL